MRLPASAALLVAALSAQPTLAQQPAPAPDTDQAVLMRSVLEALRVNTAALQRNSQVVETFANRLERVEAATRSVPPALEGVRTDLIAIRAGIERMATQTSGKRPAVTLRFSPFACGNEAEASCVANACKSVGYPNGAAVSVARTGSGTNVRPTSVSEATCYE